MIDRAHAERLLAARRSRAARPDALALVRAMAAKLRAFFYPKQAAFYTSRAKRKATKKTRRSGATAGGCRELIARAIEQPGFRAVYATTTRIEAKARAWQNDTKSGLVDILHEYGRPLDGSGVEAVDMAGVRVDIRAGELALVFGNGSMIELFGADDEKAIQKLRGVAKHVYWVDESQDFRWLERFYKGVISPGTADFDGEVWLTGTPGVDLIGFFYDVTRDDGEPLSGWEVHQIAVVDNPYFGAVAWDRGEWFVVDNIGQQTGPYADEAEAEAAAVQVRWERTAGAAIRDNKWEADDPDLLREWYARWVKSDARYVYAAHAVPEHVLTYAPIRYLDDGFPDIKLCLMDLPGWCDSRPYVLGIGSDLGTTRAFSWTMAAWSLLDPILYEVATWKMAGLSYNEMAAILHRVKAAAQVSMWVADAGGGGKPAVLDWTREWQDRYQLPLVPAEKPNKAMAIKMVNGDAKDGYLRLRAGGPLITEWKTHRWAPLKSTDVDGVSRMTEDPRSHRDSSDGFLYIHRHSYHHRYREPAPKIIPGTPEWVLKEERELEEVNCEQDDGYR